MCHAALANRMAEGVLVISHGRAQNCRESFNHGYVGATSHAPPLPPKLITDRWMLDHNRAQVCGGA